jgi:uncharacterized protein
MPLNGPEMLRETIRAKGHPNVTARHRTTFEITKESHLTPQGDCIIAVSADRGLTDFSSEFREALKKGDSILEIRMVCCGIEEKVFSRGHQDLSFTSHEEMVVRKSVFTCGRTLSVGSDKASCDLRRDFVKKLKEGNPILIELIIANKLKSG